MRIVIIAEVYLPKIDGVVVRTLNLIRELQAADDQVLVICPEVNGPRNSPVPVVDFPGFSFPMYPEYRIGHPDARLEAAVRKFNPDIVHFLNPFAFGFQCYDRLAKAKLEVATVFSFHTLYAEFAKRYGVLRPLSQWLWWQARHYHNQADANLTVSDVQVRDLQERGFQRVSLWQPAVDTDLFRPGPRCQQDISDSLATMGNGNRISSSDQCTHGNNARPLHLLTVSRLAPEKNVEFLKSILLVTPNAHLTIVGDGPHRPFLERHFDGLPVNFIGYLQNQALADAYASADAFVYASETETMGNVILEAMASGLPVIAPRAGGIPSLISHGHSGLLFEPGDAQTAAKHLQNVRSNDTLRESLTRHARKFAEQHDWTSAATRVREDYQKAAARFQQNPHPLPQTSLAARATTRSLVGTFRVVSKLTQKPAASKARSPDAQTASAAAQDSGAGTTATLVHQQPAMPIADKKQTVEPIHS